MSQKKVDYSKGIIYKLCCKNPNIENIYIGSTTNLKNRKKKHKSDCHNNNQRNYNGYKYEFIRDNGGFENWDMIMIEEYCCNSKKELETRERYWIEELKSDLNSVKRPSTTIEELKDNTKEYNKKYREGNKDKLTIKKKEYYEKNKTKILEEQKKNREDNKEHYKEYRKKYREENKEINKEYKKKYYEKNKIKILEEQKKYREDNKEHYKEYHKKYKEENKDKIKKKQKEWYEKNKINEIENEINELKC